MKVVPDEGAAGGSSEAAAASVANTKLAMEAGKTYALKINGKYCGANVNDKSDNSLYGIVTCDIEPPAPNTDLPPRARFRAHKESIALSSDLLDKLDISWKMEKTEIIQLQNLATNVYCADDKDDVVRCNRPDIRTWENFRVARDPKYVPAVPVRPGGEVTEAQSARARLMAEDGAWKQLEALKKQAAIVQQASQMLESSDDDAPPDDRPTSKSVPPADEGNTLSKQRRQRARAKQAEKVQLALVHKQVAIMNGGKYCCTTKEDNGSNLFVRCNKSEDDFRGSTADIQRTCLFNVHKPHGEADMNIWKGKLKENTKKMGDKTGKGMFMLSSQSTGLYCADDNNEWKCDRPSPGSWEIFEELSDPSFDEESKIQGLGHHPGQPCGRYTKGGPFKDRLLCLRDGSRDPKTKNEGDIDFDFFIQSVYAGENNKLVMESEKSCQNLKKDGCPPDDQRKCPVSCPQPASAAAAADATDAVPSTQGAAPNGKGAAPSWRLYGSHHGKLCGVISGDQENIGRMKCKFDPNEIEETLTDIQVEEVEEEQRKEAIQTYLDSEGGKGKGVVNYDLDSTCKKMAERYKGLADDDSQGMDVSDGPRRPSLRAYIIRWTKTATNANKENVADKLVEMIAGTDGEASRGKSFNDVQSEKIKKCQWEPKGEPKGEPKEEGQKHRRHAKIKDVHNEFKDVVANVCYLDLGCQHVSDQPWATEMGTFGINSITTELQSTQHPSSTP